ncbi:MAG: tetratricopeptide repeat protein, partial [Pseudomonadota bacterium]|nr:tetratricopeptide repeat protein [Pseudomonadota bacterium]
LHICAKNPVLHANYQRVTLQMAVFSQELQTSELGNPERALELAEQALAIRRELFGGRHPDTARSLNNVAGYTSKLGNSERALELAEQALGIRRELFGNQHPAIAISLCSTAAYLRDLGKPDKAYSRAKAAYDMQRQLLGAEHPDTLRTARLLAQIKRPGFRVPSSKKGRPARKRRKQRK